MALPWKYELIVVGGLARNSILHAMSQTHAIEEVGLAYHMPKPESVVRTVTARGARTHQDAQGAAPDHHPSRGSARYGKVSQI